MNLTSSKTHNVSRLIYIIGAFLFAVLFAVSTMGDASANSQFMPVVGGLVIMVAGTAAICSVPVLLLFKKDEAAKIIFTLLVGYWIVSQGLNYLSYSQFAVDGAPGIYVAAGIFGFLAGLALVALVVFIILHFVLGKKPIFLKVAFFILLGVVGLIVLTGILMIIAQGKYDAGWSAILSTVAYSFVASFLVLVGYVHFYLSAQK